MKATLYTMVFIAFTTLILTSCKKDDGSSNDPGNTGTGIGFTVDNSYAMRKSQGHFLMLQADKKVICATSNEGIVRLNADGALDNSFQADPSVANSGIYYSGLALQPDGKMLVLANENGNLNPIGIHRLNTDGSLDAGFQGPALVTTPSTRYKIITILPLPSGGVAIGGDFEYKIGGTTYYNLARLRADGTIDGAFLSPVANTSTISALALAPDGQVIISGRFYGNLGPGVTNAFLKINSANAAIDVNFRLADKIWSSVNNISGTSYETGVDEILPLSDGKYLIHGDFGSIGADASSGNTYPGLARLNSDGSEDKTFKPDVQYTGPVAPLADGRILMGRYARAFTSGVKEFFTVLDVSGKMLHPYNSLGFDNSTISTILKLSETEFLLGGSFIKGTTDLGVVKIKK